MLSERVKERRETLGIAQKDLSLKAGVSIGYVSQLESGFSKNPSYETLYKLASALETSVEYLYGKVDTQPERRCENCDYFDRYVDLGENNHLGLCRRSIRPMGSQFPVIAIDDWCGEFKVR